MKLLRDTVDKAVKWIGEWHHARYLKKMGWTQRQYDLNNDPDYNPKGQYLRSNVYHGYPYLVTYDDANTLERRFGKGWVAVNTDMDRWCEDNVVGKWREDIHAVEYERWHDDWVQGCMGLSPCVLVFAFNNEQDAIMFSLRWSV